MRFSLKLAVSAAVLAGSSLAEVNHSAQVQQNSGELDTKYQQSSEYGNQEVSVFSLKINSMASNKTWIMNEWI